MASSNITFIGAFIAGLLSFLSPCVLPLIPSYITYITGISFAELQDDHPNHEIRRRTVIHSLLFILGFTCIFVLLGASATFIGNILQSHMREVRKLGGILIIIFGIHLSGLLPIHFLLGDKRFVVKNRPAGYLGSFLIGIAFAAGWTPCIGPILASILMVAATEETVGYGIALLLAYSFGLGLPFFLSALALHRFLIIFNRCRKYIRIFEITTGIFLLIIGVMVFTNSLANVQVWAGRLFND
jgi:cytochrome c-type biogenesis protein